ncbi:hypothetical protein [Streptosporangium roseum]|uniref:hypothetical protein n=1 Tax=Streptosporangium roseum TaxID=2001 RepID=UPI00331A6A0B
MLQVEIFDIEGKDPGGPDGGLVEHPPQRPLTQRDVAARQQPADRDLGDRAGLVGGFL